MKLNNELEALLNAQVNMEIEAAHQYKAMAAYFEGRELEGFAKWMDAQVQEELGHSRKIYDYIFKRDGKVEYFALEKPKADFSSVKEVFEVALAHEQKVTAAIRALYKAARDAEDYGVETFLKFFIEEQEEEEETVKKIIDKVTFLDADNKNVNLYLLDKEMGERK